MTHYDSTARVPFAKGGSVKDKVMKGVKTFNKTLLGPKLYQKFYGGALPNKKYKGKVHSTAAGRRAAGRRNMKRGAKKSLKIASYVHPLTAGFKLGKKFRDKKRKVEHN